MPNSDNQHGVFNKETVIYSRAAENDDATFNNVDEAKAHLLSAAALTVIDECATQVQWELVGNTGLKVTYAFGTKGTGTAPEDDWTNQFAVRSKALWDEIKGPFNVSAISFDHSDTSTTSTSKQGKDTATVTATGHTFIVGDRVVFEGLGGFSGTSQNGNLNEDPGSEVASVSGNNFTIEETDNRETHTYTSGGTVRALDNSWQRHGSTWAESTDHLF